MQDKVVLITGGTNGVGKAAAQALAGMGATVVIVGRNAAKTQRVVDELKAATHNDTVAYLLADLSVQAEIHRLAAEFLHRYDRLDVLINNAGGIFLERELTADGLEMTFALNHLNYFLLTNLLLDQLKASAPARIVNVSSDAHRGSKLDFDNLQGEQSYSGWRAYGRSKLANLLFTEELARRLEGTGVTANALHPGFVNSGFGKNNSGGAWIALFTKLYDWLGPLLGRSPEEGAETAVYLAASPAVAGVSGKYFADCKAKTPAVAATDRATAARLWAVSEGLVNLTPAPFRGMKPPQLAAD
jgi:NAD(P)-dependent dehydrogenase (short-subunit alcohol dehydrogenase family)